MSTINQLRKQARTQKSKRNTRSLLSGCPMKKAQVEQMQKHNPKKPNSARRTVAKIKIKQSKLNGFCHVPGSKHNLSKHSIIMIRGGRCQDLIGVKYKPIFGLGNLSSVDRRSRFTKFGLSAKKKKIEMKNS